MIDFNVYFYYLLQKLQISNRSEHRWYTINKAYHFGLIFVHVDSYLKNVELFNLYYCRTRLLLLYRFILCGSLRFSFKVFNIITLKSPSN